MCPPGSYLQMADKLLFSLVREPISIELRKVKKVERRYYVFLMTRAKKALLREVKGSYILRLLCIIRLLKRRFKKGVIIFFTQFDTYRLSYFS